MKNSPVAYAALAGLTLCIFTLDLITPLGVVVWILYVVPIALTLFGERSDVPIFGAVTCTLFMLITLASDPAGVLGFGVAALNRACGIVVVWTLALLAHNLIETRNCLRDEEWIRAAQTALLEELQGERVSADIGAITLRHLSSALDAPVGAVYAYEGDVLRLAAARGLAPDVDVPAVVATGAGLVGEAARSRSTAVIDPLPPGYLEVHSALGRKVPSHLVLTPLAIDGTTHGVMELGLFTRPSPRAMTLLDRVGDGVGVALRSAAYRERMRTLLIERQRQAEELQAQQEELRVTNEELEEQSRALTASQARLEEQQADLETSNAQLSIQASELEQQKRTLQAARMEAERASQYKSDFLANMSHELRTPLNSSLILARLLADNKGGHLTEEQVRFAETIYSSGNNLLTLINDILDLSKIEAGAIEIDAAPTSLPELTQSLRQTFAPIAADKRLALSIDLAADVPGTITTDRVRLKQILTNLLSNALKFTERGQVAVTVTRHGDTHVAFAVRDTGIGIPDDKHAVIFHPFMQAHTNGPSAYGGTGLGLSISLELAHLLRGDLRVESTPGSGSTFTLVVPTAWTAAAPMRQAGLPPPVRRELPRAEPAREMPGANPTPAPRPHVADDRDALKRPNRVILVVEDDPHFGGILCDLAHDLDFDCVVASSTDEGMALARDLAPTGILLDVGLPDGSGLTLLDRLKRNPDTRHIPVHMVSVSDRTYTAMQFGAIGYALKPVQREELAKAICGLESRATERPRRVLVVEDDVPLRESIRQLLTIDGVAIDDVGSGGEALEHLSSTSYDCVVLDLNLPDGSGYHVLETMSASERHSFPPVIIYTGRALSNEEEDRLRRYSRSVIIKGARSPERLLDEVTLFLHQVESRLPPEAQRLLRASRERDASFEGRVIVIAEDDVRNVFALTSVFEPLGATVVIARNGREAIERVKAQRPDLVLMDIMMPEMDGLAATRALRAEQAYANLPIIALTAKAMRDSYAECLAAGANDYIAKPLDVEKLVSLCRVWMSR